MVDTAEAVLLQRRRGSLGGEGRSLLNEAAELAPHSATKPLMRPASGTPWVPKANAYHECSQPPRAAIVAGACRLVSAQSEICTVQD